MKKSSKTWIVLLIIAVVAAALFFIRFTSDEPTRWGVTFSKNYAQYELGLDWKRTYLAILDDLKVDHIRLSAYWNEVEPTVGTYDFTDLDWQMEQATQRDAKIILAVGRRLPRWPECHDPAWLSSITREQGKSRQLEYVKAVIGRYGDNPNIEYVQVENEPFLKYFGECPPLDREFFKQEVALAKSLTDKPILITDSGELSTWLPAARAGGDVLGTTLYRVVHNETLGYIKYFIPPSFYFGKAALVRTLTPTDKVIVAELQAEAWHSGEANLSRMDLDDAAKSLSLKQLQKNIAFARQAGFDEVYLWGVEWWYLAKERDGYSGYWDEAGKLWNN